MTKESCFFSVDLSSGIASSGSVDLSGSHVVFIVNSSLILVLFPTKNCCPLISSQTVTLGWTKEFSWIALNCSS